MVDAYTRTWPARYEMLDGLRGLACLGVPLQHLSVAPVFSAAAWTIYRKRTFRKKINTDTGRHP